MLQQLSKGGITVIIFISKMTVIVAELELEACSV